MAPTNVSFYRVQLKEVPENASNQQDWFSIYGAPNHDSAHGADHWYQLQHDNSWDQNDHAIGGVYNQPWSGQGWSGGSFTWHIPFAWKVGNSPVHTNNLGWDQHFTLSGNGTVIVTKFLHTATRSPNQSCTVAQ